MLEDDPVADAVWALARAELDEKHVHGAEIGLLVDTLAEDESVLHLANAAYGTKTGLLAATTRRLVFTYAGVFSPTIVAVPWERLSRARYEVGRRAGKLVVGTAQARYEFALVKPKEKAAVIGEYARSQAWQRRDDRDPRDAFAEGSLTPRAHELFEHLHVLRDAGVLTPEEYKEITERIDGGPQIF